MTARELTTAAQKLRDNPHEYIALGYPDIADHLVSMLEDTAEGFDPRVASSQEEDLIDIARVINGSES